MTTLLKNLLPRQPGPLSFVDLGLILLNEHGHESVKSGYGTTDPEWVGRYGLIYNDIDPDGTLT